MPRLESLVLALAVTRGVSSSLQVNIRYPESRLSELGGSGIYVRGSGCGLSWLHGVQATKTRTVQDTWSITVPPCSEAQLEFKALIDDSAWMVGANAMADLAALGGNTSATSVTVYPWFQNGQGKIEVISNVESPQGLRARDVAIYLPPSYVENSLKPYENVLIAHDGNNLFNGNQCAQCCSFGCWGLDSVLDSLICASDPGQMEEVVVVGPYNSPDRMDEYTYSRDPQYGGGKLEVYLSFLQDTLLPLVARKYPRVVGAQQGPWAIMGSSLGGLASCYAGWKQGSVFAPSICMSSSFWWNSQDFKGTVLAGDAPGQPAAHPFYVDWGSSESDDQTVSNKAVVQSFQSLGWGSDLSYYEQPGGVHNEKSWGSRVNKPLNLFFPPKALRPDAAELTKSVLV